MLAEELKPNVTVTGPLFPEPVEILTLMPMGSSVKLVARGIRSNTVFQPILTADQLALLTASPAQEPFDGDAGKFRLVEIDFQKTLHGSVSGFAPCLAGRALDSWPPSADPAWTVR